MRQVIRFRNPDSNHAETKPPVEVSFYWKREDGWIEYERSVRQSALAETGRTLWRELFLSVETAEKLADWESRIPQYECNCKQFYLEWKAINPPSFPLPARWKYDLKSAVNAKLNQPNISYSDACKLWNWPLTSPNPPA